MNRIIKYMMTCTALSLLITFGGCDEQEAALYSDEPKISFTRGDNGYGQQDSVTQSFFLLPSDQLRDTVWVELSLEGTSSTIPRTIKIEQTNVGKVGAADYSEQTGSHRAGCAGRRERVCGGNGGEPAVCALRRRT